MLLPFNQVRFWVTSLINIHLVKIALGYTALIFTAYTIIGAQYPFSIVYDIDTKIAKKTAIIITIINNC